VAGLQVHLRFPALAVKHAEAAGHPYQVVAITRHSAVALAQLDALHKGQVIVLQKLQATEEVVEPAATSGDLLGEQGVRDAGVMELIA